ncbi:hypothetical protein IWW43_002948, partial [Coemansia sp. RSA 1935]
MVFSKPVRKKRNFKSLTLAVSETTPAPATSATGSAQAQTSKAPPSLISNKSAPAPMVGAFNESVLPLELGVEL